MLYNFRLLHQTTWNIIKQRNQAPFKRIIFLVLWLLVWIPHSIAVWLCFGLDAIFFRGYKNVAVTKPLFIIGNQRSGSTFLHRTLATDKKTFTTMTSWDVFVAPSITQQKIIRAISRLDRDLLGYSLHKILYAIDAQTYGRINVHAISLFQPEEDEGLFLHIYDGYYLEFLFPNTHDSTMHWKFDASKEQKRKAKMMKFYKQAIQRKLYMHPGTHYLAKNPASTGRIKSLQELFPDACFLYLLRDPLETFASSLSWGNYSRSIFGAAGGPEQYRKQQLTITKYWYSYPSKVLVKVENGNRMVLPYEKLIKNPEKSVALLYKKLGYPEPKAIHIPDASETRRPHHYSYDELGLNKIQIATEFSVIAGSIEILKNLA